MSEEEQTLTTTNDKPTEEKELTEDELAKEAEASFSAGFAKAKGENEVPAEKPAEAPATTEPEVEATAPATEPASTESAEPAEQTDLEKAYKRIQKLEGSLGNLSQRFNRLNATQTQSVASNTTAKPSDESPSTKQVSAALKNDGKLKDLIADFPDFEPVMLELQALRDESQGAMQQIDSKALVEQATNQAIHRLETDALTRAHPGWAEEVKTDEFKKWSLEGGPTSTEFAKLQVTSQYDQNQAQQIVTAWQGLYPDWWLNKGSTMFSDRPSDIQIVLDSYSESRATPAATTAPAKADKKARNTKRLAAALSPEGSPEAPTPGITDNEAFSRGFKKASGR